MEQNPIPQQHNSPTGSQMGAFEAGDIILTPSEPQKKSRKGLIILIVVLVLFALAGVGLMIYNTINKNEDDEGSFAIVVGSESEIQEAFNKYVNYIFDGKKDSENRIDFVKIAEEYEQDSLKMYIESASFEEIKEANDLYEDFFDKYYKATLTEAQDYFYYYLGCQNGMIDAKECSVNLGKDYESYYEFNSNEAVESVVLIKKASLRLAALQSIFDTYYDIYGSNEIILSGDGDA